MFSVQVTRRWFRLHDTLGDLTINGVAECHTLEDRVREIPDVPVEKWKIPHETAIPSGTYDLTIDYSNRFGRPMPHILNVPGFEGIRIHKGNTDRDTEGCILLGRALGTDCIVPWTSKPAFDQFFFKLKSAIDAGEKASITIINTVGSKAKAREAVA